MKRLVLLTLFGSMGCRPMMRQVKAEETFISFGVGMGNSAKNSAGEVKNGNVGLRTELFDGIYWQYKAGYFGDGSGDKTRKGSGYIAAGPGMLIDLRPVEMRAGYGLGVITTPDAYLGGRFPQFFGEFYLGLRDHRGNGIGLQYEHISSAGIVSPNKGRDFVVLQLSQRF